MCDLGEENEMRELDVLEDEDELLDMATERTSES